MLCLKMAFSVPESCYTGFPEWFWCNCITPGFHFISYIRSWKNRQHVQLWKCLIYFNSCQWPPLNSGQDFSSGVCADPCTLLLLKPPYNGHLSTCNGQNVSSHSTVRRSIHFTLIETYLQRSSLYNGQDFSSWPCAEPYTLLSLKPPYNSHPCITATPL